LSQEAFPGAARHVEKQTILCHGSALCTAVPGIIPAPEQGGFGALQAPILQGTIPLQSRLNLASNFS